MSIGQFIVGALAVAGALTMATENAVWFKAALVAGVLFVAGQFVDDFNRGRRNRRRRQQRRRSQRRGPVKAR